MSQEKGRGVVTDQTEIVFSVPLGELITTSGSTGGSDGIGVSAGSTWPALDVASEGRGSERLDSEGADADGRVGASVA